MKTSGVVLDLYDDPASLKEIYGRLSDIPETVKNAHALNHEELDLLPDSSFALVMIDGDRKIRKYACIDRGNTELSLAYFSKFGHRLPEEAQKVAAANLQRACEWYEVEAPAGLEKVALGLMQAAHLALVGPAVAKGTKNQIDSNLAGVKALEGPGRVVTPGEASMVGPLVKGAEVSGTHLAPHASSCPCGDCRSKAPAHPKVASETELATAKPIETEQYQKAPQSKDLKPHVQISGKEPPRVVSEKTAENYALGGVYPIDSYDEVRRASAYFDEFGKRMHPEERHEYCVNLVKRASKLGIGVSPLAQKYGSETYASKEEIKVALDLRRQVLQDERFVDMLNGLEKSAESVHPDVFCEALSSIDKLAEIDWLYDRAIQDPYLSTYGIKTAEDEGKTDDSWIDGNRYVSRGELEEWGKKSWSSLRESFGEDVANEFRKDPWGIFMSMPLTEKRMIADMSTDNSSSVNHQMIA